MNAVKLSKRLSLILRHRPASVGLPLDDAGWVSVDELLVALAAHGLSLTRDELDEVVRSNDKQRFAFDDTRTKIRANQGHSVQVDLGYSSESPPDVLFHGTPTRNVASILRGGLEPRGRHAVHLSADVRTAEIVGARRGHFVVLAVDAKAMTADGHSFARSANGVWLVDVVPPEYISHPASGDIAG